MAVMWVSVVAVSLRRRVSLQEMSGLYSPMEAECTVPNVEAPSPAPRYSLTPIRPAAARRGRHLSSALLSFLCSCSSIMDPPDYNQPPGFGGTNQVNGNGCHGDRRHIAPQ